MFHDGITSNLTDPFDVSIFLQLFVVHVALYISELINVKRNINEINQLSAITTILRKTNEFH